MKIVFEGPDGAGKSTIAKMVAEKLGINLRGRITRKGPDLVEQANKDDLNIDGDYVFDRCYWVSDLVYEPIYSGRLSVFAGEGQAQKQWMENHNVLLIYVRCLESDIRQRIETRGDDLYNLDQILIAREAYEEYMMNQNLADIVITNTQGDSLEDVVKDCIEKIKKFGGNK